MSERLAHVVACRVSEGGSFLYVHPQTMRSGQEVRNTITYIYPRVQPVRVVVTLF